MTTWLSDASANRHIKTYVKDFLDVSGNFSVTTAIPHVEATSTTTYDWKARGQVLAGPDRNDSTIYFGRGLDMDASGNTIAGGAYDYSYSHHSGAVLVYAYDASAQVWYQKGNVIHSPNPSHDDDFGAVLEMSADGNRILIMDARWYVKRGNTVIVDYNSSTNNWDYQLNLGGADKEYLGLNGASLSGNGLVYAVTVNNVTATRLYRWNGSSWGSPYQWNNYHYPSLNYDGNRLIYYFTSGNAYKVMEWNGSSYAQLGASIYLPGNTHNNANATAINNEGNIVAIAVPANDFIAVLQYDSASNSWLRLGNYLYGPAMSGSSGDPGTGASVRRLRLNGAGDHIIYAAATAYRTAYVYKYDASLNDWTQVYNDLRAPEEVNNNDESYGICVAISDDATKIAVGAQNAEIKYGDSGAVYAYEPGYITTTTLPKNYPSYKAIDISNGNLSINKQVITEPNFKVEKFRPSDTTYQQEYGLGVALNGDGNIMAIGAPLATNLSGNTRAGYVEVKQYSNGSWSALGSKIYGPSTEFYFGLRVALDNSGTRLLVAATDTSNSSKGAMLVYDWSGSSWVQVGSKISGTSSNDRFSWTGGVAMNSTGDIIVGMSSQGGYVRAYQYDGSSWSQLGSDISITGGFNDGHGTRVALNDDGTILAVGNVSNDAIGTNDGLISVYQFTNGSWNQFGGNIATIAFGNQHYFGMNVSLSADGYTLFTSSRLYQADTGEGRAYIYSEDADKWVELGPPINADTMYNETNSYMGASSDISKDGTTVVFSDHHNDTGGTNRGAMMMFKYTEGYWKQIATAYFSDYGAPNESYPGYHGCIRMNRDGTRIIVGAYTDDEGATNVGSAYVLDYTESGIVTSSIEPMLTASATNQTASLPVFELTSNGSNTTYLKDKKDSNNTIMSWSTAGGNHLTPNYTDGISLYSNNTRRASISSRGVLRIAGGGWDFTPYNSDYYEMKYGNGMFYSRRNTIHNNGLAVDGAIGCSTYIGVVSIYSDRRIKTNIQTIDDASALEKLRLLNPCTYEYIDKMERGTDIVEGFIAQEVREVIPAAIRYTTYELPNIYKVGTHSVDASGNHFFTIPDYDTANLELDPSGNIFPALMVYDKEDVPLGKIDIIKVVSSTVLQVELVDKQDKLVPEDIFVYGQFISHILMLDKDKIFTVATAAMQEVDRQLQADKAKTATMESQVADLLARVTALENK